MSKINEKFDNVNRELVELNPEEALRQLVPVLMDFFGIGTAIIEKEIIIEKPIEVVRQVEIKSTAEIERIRALEAEIEQLKSASAAAIEKATTAITAPLKARIEELEQQIAFTVDEKNIIETELKNTIKTASQQEKKYNTKIKKLTDKIQKLTKIIANGENNE